MDCKLILQNAGIIAKNGLIEAIEQHCKEEVALATLNQREDDIRAAIRGFIDLRASDVQIMLLLQKYFNVESISEANTYIHDVKAWDQICKLKAYLGLRGLEWINYKHEYSVFEKIDTNPKLLDLSVEKLKIAIEKK